MPVDRMASRRARAPKALFAGASALVLVLVFASLALAQAKLTVAVHFASNSQEARGFMEVKEAFEQLHPGVEVEYLWTTSLAGSGLSHTSKLLTMIAGGTSPDVAMVVSHLTPAYAHQGILAGIGSYMERAGVNRSDIIPPALMQGVWEGEVYALPLIVDPNFAMVWNKQYFAEAGLDPNRGPATLAEYEEYYRRLTRRGPDGTVTRIAHTLWSAYGYVNAMWTWGWIFQGDFYDYATHTVTAADPKLVEALEFLKRYHDEYNVPALPREMYFPDNEAINFWVSGHLKYLLDTRPELEIGVGPMPRLDEGAPSPAWIGGYGIGVLKDAPNPDLAWEFVRFIAASEQGTSIFGSVSGWIPGYLRSGVMQEFLRDPYMGVYLQVAQEARHWRPAMPAIVEYEQLLNSYVAQVLAGERVPVDALREVQQLVQAQLDEILAR